MFFKAKLKLKSNSRPLDLRTVNKRSPFWKPLIFLLPTFLILIGFTVYPFIITAGQSVQTTIPRSHEMALGWKNFDILFKDPQFVTSISNSFLYAIIALPAGLFIAILISAAIAGVVRKRIRGAWQTLFFLPYVTSAIAVAIAFAYLFDADNGIINKIFGHNSNWLTDTENHGSLWAMLIYGVWRSIAFNVLILTTAMISVDKNKYKAASIDGAGPIRQFFSITLPSINKTINFLITVGLIGALKVFPLALFQNVSKDALTHKGGTFMLYIFDKIRNTPRLAAAASVILLVVSIGFNVAVKSILRSTVWVFRKAGERNVSNKINSIKQIQKL